MKIFVTGSTGMVGKNFLEDPRVGDYKILAPQSIDLDLTDENAVVDYVHVNKPDMIVHCAGVVGGIQANINEPYRFLAANSAMALSLVNAARRFGVRKFLNLGSSCMYPRSYRNPLREEDILQGELEPTNEGYALAKILCARLCEYTTRENKEYHYKTLIPCNLFGRWDKFDPQKSHMIPAAIQKIHQAKEQALDTVEIWGSGEVRREFMLASELVDFMYWAVENMEKLPQNLNVGIGQDYSINEYYEEIKSVVGYQGQFHHNLERPEGMKQKLMDSSKVNALGWRPKHSLREGLEKTYDFFTSEVLG